MKIKCPGCGKVLSIPEAAAGKIVKCPCGKQLRAPGGAKSPAAAAKPTAAPKKAAARPAQPAARPAQPAAKAAQPRPAQPQRPAPVAAPSLDDDLFGELTENDLAPVKSVYSPGQKAPVAAGSPSAAVETTSSNRSVPKIAFGSVLILAGVIGIGAFFMGAFDREDGDRIRIRRRSPLGICIGVIITGFGWAAAGINGSDGDDDE
ncbi:MAG: hypothetical protein WBD20_17720 [Pirellulaceae bacterium]